MYIDHIYLSYAVESYIQFETLRCIKILGNYLLFVLRKSLKIECKSMDRADKMKKIISAIVLKSRRCSNKRSKIMRGAFFHNTL